MIAGVHHRGRVDWYDADLELWVLDHAAWAKAFEQIGYPGPSGHNDRFDLPVVDTSTIDEFLDHMAPYRLEQSGLRELFVEACQPDATWWDVVDFLPMVYIDVAQRTLWSIYPETTTLSTFVPEGWVGRGESFFDRVPQRHRYWVIDGVDRLRAFLG